MDACLVLLTELKCDFGSLIWNVAEIQPLQTSLSRILVSSCRALALAAEQQAENSGDGAHSFDIQLTVEPALACHDQDGASANAPAVMITLVQEQVSHAPAISALSALSLSLSLSLSPRHCLISPSLQAHKPWTLGQLGHALCPKHICRRPASLTYLSLNGTRV